jgi:hypothetical protein
MLLERVWNYLSPVGLAAQYEREIQASLGYLWLTHDDLHKSRERYQVPWFLLSLLQQVYRRVLTAGQYAPFPVVAYLAVGYTLRQIDVRLTNEPRGASVPRESSRALQRSRSSPEVVSAFITELNRWLSTALRYERLDDFNRHNWLALWQFVHRTLNEIGPPTAVRLRPDICDSEWVKAYLIDEIAGVEPRLLRGQPPPRKLRESRVTADYLKEMTELIRQRLRAPFKSQSALEEEQRRIEEEQARAIRYYLGRAGVSPMYEATNSPDAEGGSKAFLSQARVTRQHLLDFHALAGYQAYGKFIPDTRTNLLLEQLRRQLLEPTIAQRARESTVDGTTRKGKINQVLKWQLALHPEYVYERYFNHKLLYLRQVSRKSQNLYFTLLLIIDLAAPSHRQAFHGGRIHGLERETGAHFLQDCYQILYRIPKLYADTLIVLCEGGRILWCSAVELSKGDGQLPDKRNDLFLQDPPIWLRDLSGFSDPSTFFHFLLPMFHPPKSAKDDLGDQIVGHIREMRFARAGWYQARNQDRETRVCRLPSADLMVTIYAYPKHSGGTHIPEWYDDLYALALSHQLWMCECGENSIGLFRCGEDTQDQLLECHFSAFQEQQALTLGSRGSDAPMRQQFVQEVLRALINLCTQLEMV